MATSNDETTPTALTSGSADVIGLLADEHDFRAMRRYRTFAFDDHAAYMRQVEALLISRARQGHHTTVALFDPQDYADFCSEHGLNPDLRTSRSRFTAELTTIGPTISYEGQTLAELVHDLVDEAVRQATWEYATALLARLGACPNCGKDIGRAAFSHATHLLLSVLGTAPPGDRHLVCSIGAAETLVAVLHADQTPDGSNRFEEGDGLAFAAVLAAGVVTGSPGGLVMRTHAPGTPDRVYGWRMLSTGFQPLTAAEVFYAYCIDVESGDLISPESNVEYCAAPDLDKEGPSRATCH